ncbi:MAG: DUF1616 domain-containing protein [Candidatus Bathyarchaeota archaeon]|nr:DUF1616 domain-containing protein [Candidatus Bathyarchaeota archaeon]
MQTLSRKLNIKENKNAFAVSVAIALLLASVLLVTYYVALRPEPDEYTTIYLLDSNKKASDYPEFLVANVNSTFSVYVNVENHLGRTLDDFQVLVKATTDVNPTFPIEDVNATQTITGTLKDGEATSTVVTMGLNQPADYLVAFELWIPNEDTGKMEFSDNYCVLNVQVAAEQVAI